VSDTDAERPVERDSIVSTEYEEYEDGIDLRRGTSLYGFISGE
jgi:hypothetical protein